MLHHVKESTVFTFGLVRTFFKFLWYGMVALSDWLKGFTLINEWVFVFFLPKLFIVLIGLLVTPLPLWVLIPLSFAPPGAVGGVFFIAFIMAFAQ